MWLMSTPRKVDRFVILTTVPLQDEFDLKGVPVVIVMGLFGGGNKEEIRKQIHEALAGS